MAATVGNFAPAMPSLEEQYSDVPLDTLSQLMATLWRHEPDLLKRALDLMFVPCTEDRVGKHRFVLALLTPGTTKIAGYAFQGNKVLEWCRLDKRVTHIGDGAFYGCTGLTTITLPPGLALLGDYAFSHCKELREARVSAGLGIFRKTFPEYTKIIRR